MVQKPIAPRIALNKSYLKVKPNRNDIEKFKTHVIELLDQINEKETEEFHKNIISKFLDKTYYTGNHYINTKGRNDLVIHTDKDAKSSVGVIIETKKPTNKVEMVQKGNLNTKAFQELVLYYMRERISGNNLEVKHLIITNIYEWFIFDVDIFEKAFAQNKDFEKKFVDFEEKRLAGKNTDFFYKEIAEPAVAELLAGKSKAVKELSFTYFDIREYEKIVRNNDKQDDNKLIALFKLLSPEHLLKLAFRNDSNSLDKTFYAELLHIIGLTEVKDGSKKLIDRKDEKNRDDGSILENTITQLDSLDKLSRLDKPAQYGATNKERYFNVGLELVITWINRVLFLKLLEAQLVTYHKGDKAYSFLNKEKIKSFDDLNGLFFQVLAKENKDRAAVVKAAFNNVPYLNSSLFEPSDLEQVCFPISQLQDNRKIPILSNTVLKDNNGKRRSGNLNALEYLFSFLDAYDFASDGSEEIQEENKALISASVLGLIFEKINGYKDGSFFTPGFITMYMCRETIRRAVVQKFNESKGWKCKSFEELYDKIEDKKEANEIVNNLKIVDPAVGSGHFLVSALNEIIALKSDLKILLDRTGKTLRDYHIEVSNDELAITDEDGNLFEYNPKNKESQRIQEALFHDKQTIIENCLFGVDINTNSVKICRLRLWIELLKNAYYKSDTELETLPNIDINIKCGNSLISRYPLNVDLKQALRKSKITIKQYKDAVQSYRHATNKDQKREMESLIAKIKGDFKTEISNNDPLIKKLNSKRGERDLLVNQHQLFETTNAEKKDRTKKIERLENELEKLEKKVDDIKTNKIFENAFEWRFEFPEVLDNDADFVGFDVIIGNPPYGISIDKLLEPTYKSCYPLSNYKLNLYTMFIERFTKDILGHNQSILSFIIPQSLVVNSYFENLRSFLINQTALHQFVYCDKKIFSEAEVGGSLIIDLVANRRPDNSTIFKVVRASDFAEDQFETVLVNQNEYISQGISNISHIQKKSGSIFSRLSEMEFVSSRYDLKNGLNPGNVKHILISRENKSNKYRKIIWGKDISKFEIEWSGDYINYDPSLKETITIKDIKSKPGMNKQNRVDFALRSSDLFEVEKIVVRKTGDKIIAAFDSNNYYFDTLVHGIYTKEEFSETYSLGFLLGILNSKFATWLYRSLYNVKGKAFAKISLDKLESFPLPNLDLGNQKLIEEKVLKIDKSRKEERAQLEQELNTLVCKLYQLSDDEIRLVESQ